MFRLLFVGYLIVEIAAFWAMTHFLGFGWALLITVGAAAIGFAVLGRRARSLVTDVRRAARREPTAGEPASDTALFAGSALFTLLPGVVTTVIGLVLMSAPVRRRLQPVIGRKVRERTRVIVAGVPGATMPAAGRGRYVDGTVEGTVVDQTSDVEDVTPRRPDGTVIDELPELPPTPLSRP